MDENSEIDFEDDGDYFDCVTNVNEQDGDLPKIHPSLSVLPRKQSLYLTFPEIKLECVDKLVTENLFFYKAENSKKNGFIFKTTDGSSTVTLYKTTFSLHIQGSGRYKWLKIFNDLYVLALDCEGTNTEGESETIDEINVLNESETDLKIVMMENETNLKTPIDVSPVDEQASEPIKCVNCERNDVVIRDLCDTVAKLKLEVERLSLKVSETTRAEVTTKSVQTQTYSPSKKTKSTDVYGLKDTEGYTTSRHTQCTLVSTDTPQSETIESATISDIELVTVDILEDDEGVDSNSGKSVSTSIPTEPTPRNSGKTLIVGSSIVKRIQPRGLTRSVSVSVNRGAQLPRIRQKLKRANPANFENIIIQAGGNDAANKRKTLAAIENDLVHIITDIKAVSRETKVYIAAVTCRRDTDVSKVNSIIYRVCEAHDATVIPCDEIFYNENSRLYNDDGIHLSDRGTAKLLKLYDTFVPILVPRKDNCEEKCCFFCGEHGHISKNCRHGGKVECWNCWRTGHKAKYCPY